MQCALCRYLESGTVIIHKGAFLNRFYTRVPRMVTAFAIRIMIVSCRGDASASATPYLPLRLAYTECNLQLRANGEIGGASHE